jgi:hypothetical protein
MHLALCLKCLSHVICSRWTSLEALIFVCTHGHRLVVMDVPSVNNMIYIVDQIRDVLMNGSTFIWPSFGYMVSVILMVV